jgi:phytoene/squalene synthetase
VGRIEPQDAALVALGRTLAEIIDGAEEPVTQTAYAYQQVLRQLRGEVSSATSDDDLAAWLAVLSAQMGDAPES